MFIPGWNCRSSAPKLFTMRTNGRKRALNSKSFLPCSRIPRNPARQRAQLRVVECRVQLKGSPSLIAALKPPDLEVDAERLYALSQAYRSDKKEAEMFLALNTLAQNYPVSKWN